jgi:hypothetical protein
LVSGCDDNNRVEIDLRVVSPSGGDPVDGSGATTLRVFYAHGDDALSSSDVAISDDGFDVVVPAPDLNAATFIALDLLGGAEHRVGALPPFTAVEASFAATLVVGPAGRCVPLVGPELSAPAYGVGAALVGTYGLLAGGVEADGASRRMQYFDPLRTTSGPLDDAPVALGATQVAPVTTQVALVLPEDANAFFYDLGDLDEAIFDAAVHRGSSDGGVLAPLGALGAVVVGGRVDGEAVTDLSWVGADGAITSRHLGRPRAEPAVAFDGARLWVAGGEGAGADALELASPSGDGALVIDDLGDGVRVGGFLFASPSGTDALVVGGHDALGVLRTDTVWIHGCPSECVAEPGPAWVHAREGVALLASAGLLVGGDGGGEVERVDFSAGVPTIALRGALDVPRRRPAVLPLAAGVFVVLGGEDAAGPRRDAEICFPDELDLPSDAL